MSAIETPNDTARPADAARPARDGTAHPVPTASTDYGTGEMTGHNYDGIEEYDNPMPGWWKWLFIATIVFSGGYFSLVSLTSAFSPHAEYERAQAAELQREMSATVLPSDSATLMKLMRDPSALGIGASVFASKCAPCHKPDGSGMVGLGPNLTDDFYIHVRKIGDIPEIVRNGVTNTAMPAWGKPGGLQPNEIVMVSAYVASLRGQNKPGKPVEPNAIKIAPWKE